MHRYSTSSPAEGTLKNRQKTQASKMSAAIIIKAVNKGNKVWHQLLITYAGEIAHARATLINQNKLSYIHMQQQLRSLFYK